ncbi:hypothetical protein [Actinacidiphila reveromycinica]|nr:hypothetical protein [Streptomyces sp. SN-593]
MFTPEFEKALRLLVDAPATGERAVYRAYFRVALDEIDRLRAGDGYVAGRVAGLLEAAEIVGNDDDCTCGGCDTCVGRELAAKVRDRADQLAGGGPR